MSLERLMGFLQRILAKHDAATDFERHLPVIAQAVHDLQLGVYWRLTKEYERRNLGNDGYLLAYCIVYDLFLDEEGARSLHEFAQNHVNLISEEARRAVRDDQISGALSIAYAARLMELGYLTRNPFSQEANRIVEKANSLGIEIKNIVSLWGTGAIVNLHAFAKEFRHASV